MSLVTTPVVKTTHVKYVNSFNTTETGIITSLNLSARVELSGCMPVTQ